MKSFFDFLEEEGTELDERVDSIDDSYQKGKSTKKESCQN